jgi:hypothetical protein
MKPLCREYRDYLRGVRMFLRPEHQAMLMGEKISYLRMRDLEALFELVMEANPRDWWLRANV